MINEKIIGIVGGMGPNSSLDLFKSILEQTNSQCDQDHISIAILSYPNEINDRTEFLLGNSNVNPAYSIANIILKLEQVGASVVGIPCHTAFAPEIYNVILEILFKNNCKVKIVNILDVLKNRIQEGYANKRIGILSTNGSYKTKLFTSFFEESQFNIVLPNEDVQNSVHNSIYNCDFGIKANPFIVKNESRVILYKALEYFKNKKVEVIILGCTELSLVIKEKTFLNMHIINSIELLSKTLIELVNSEKLISSK